MTPNRQSDACDIVNYEEYRAIASKIEGNLPDKAIVVFVDMNKVQKKLKKVCLLIMNTVMLHI